MLENNPNFNITYMSDSLNTVLDYVIMQTGLSR